MRLTELAAEYRDGAGRIRARIKELGKLVRHGNLSETEKYLLRGRIRLLYSMEQDMTEAAACMERYGRDE